MYVDVELTMDMGEGIAVPVPAVLPTGKHNIVFVDKGEGKLEPRFIELGRKYGDFYEVKSGLKETERVSWYASPIACQCVQPLACPPRQSANTWYRCSVASRAVSRYSSFFVPKRRKRYGCEIPAARAMSSVEAPWRPFAANSVVRRLEHRRAPLVSRLSHRVVIVVSIHSHILLSSPAQANRASASATRSNSASVSRRGEGSASARSNARIRARERPRSR